jgi:sodium/potassium/calcium exchanger 6
LGIIYRPISNTLLLDAFVERNSIWFAISGLGLSAVGLILNMIYRRFTVSYFIGPSLLLSIAWTYYLAKQLVLLMAAFSIIFQISDVMLGSLLFAFGNSIGDLIANLTMAKLGQPRLAIFACFGNPMINLSFGISVSTLFYMVVHKSPFYLLESSVSLSAFMVSAVVIYFLFGISSFLMKWKVPKWLGLCMSIAYLVGLALHVGIELKSQPK